VSAPRLAAFAAVLAVLFGGGALAGASIGPEPDDAPSETHGASPSPRSRAT